METEIFEVRQNLKTAIGGQLIVIHRGASFREAEMFYDSVVSQYPNEYFEFCKIYKKETCISFVKRESL